MWLEGIEISVPDLVSMTRMDTSKMPGTVQNVQKSIQGIYKIIFDTIDGFFDEHIQVNPKLNYNPNRPNKEEWWIHWGDMYNGWIYYVEDTVDFKETDTDLMGHHGCIKYFGMHELEEYVKLKHPGVSTAHVGDNSVNDLNDYGYGCDLVYLNVRIKKMNVRLRDTIESYPKDLQKRLWEVSDNES